jgi:starch phosphorylase
LISEDFAAVLAALIADSQELVACVRQARVDEVYRDKARWTRMSIMSTAGSGKFSSDRTIKEYADDIWRVQPCPVPAPRE